MKPNLSVGKLGCSENLYYNLSTKKCHPKEYFPFTLERDGQKIGGTNDQINTWVTQEEAKKQSLAQEGKEPVINLELVNEIMKTVRQNDNIITYNDNVESGEYIYRIVVLTGDYYRTDGYLDKESDYRYYPNQNGDLLVFVNQGVGNWLDIDPSAILCFEKS